MRPCTCCWQLQELTSARLTHLSTLTLDDLRQAKTCANNVTLTPTNTHAHTPSIYTLSDHTHALSSPHTYFHTLHTPTTTRQQQRHTHATLGGISRKGEELASRGCIHHAASRLYLRSSPPACNPQQTHAHLSTTLTNAVSVLLSTTLRCYSDAVLIAGRNCRWVLACAVACCTVACYWCRRCWNADAEGRGAACCELPQHCRGGWWKEG